MLLVVNSATKVDRPIYQKSKVITKPSTLSKAKKTSEEKDKDYMPSYFNNKNT